MKQYKTLRQSLLLFPFCAIVFSCKTQAYNTGKSGSQNFSVRYNSLYNANELINMYEESTITDSDEDYSKILPVFISPTVQTAAMNKVIAKANTIITEKNQSDYVGTAYLLLGKANFYNGDYFLALANLNIIIDEYTSQKALYTQALTLKIRCLTAIGSNEEALQLAAALATGITGKTQHTAEAYAAIAQSYLYNDQSKPALSFLQIAVHQTRNREQRIRWKYICAQLQEQLQDYQQAALNYSSVKKSSGPTEIKLSAALKFIALHSNPVNNAVNTDQAINRLLKDATYATCRDQIYYHLAENAYHKKSYVPSEKYYLKAVHEKGRNTLLTGLSFLKAADINLYHLQDYYKAALFYDSAAMNLPKTIRYSTAINTLQDLKHISIIYQSILEQDTLKNVIETPPYHQKIIDDYYEIATIYLQKIKDPAQAQNIYTLIMKRFPDNSYNQSVKRALAGSSSGNTENAFLRAYQQTPFNNAILEASEINQNRNTALIRQQQIITQQQETEKTGPATDHIKPVKKVIIPAQIQVKGTVETANYYFIVSINDVTINLSPFRYGIGEFNRSRYPGNNLKHKLLEFDNSQVIYVGLFKSIEEATNYANEITPKLKEIIKVPKGGYSSAIMSKEKLEKLETDEIWKTATGTRQ